MCAQMQSYGTETCQADVHGASGHRRVDAFSQVTRPGITRGRLACGAVNDRKIDDTECTYTASPATATHSRLSSLPLFLLPVSTARHSIPPHASCTAPPITPARLAP